MLDAKEFLKSTPDDVMHGLIAGGIPGTEVPAWSLVLGGTLTDEQVTEIATYLRSLEPNAPSVPTWRNGCPRFGIFAPTRRAPSCHEPSPHPGESSVSTGRTGS